VIYLDTSLVVALCAAERDSDRVEAALATIAEPFCTSEWTRVEFTSAVGIKVRNRELSEALARRALADYYRAFETGVTIITPSRDDYIRAAYYLQDLKSGLRSGDALHIAIAVNARVTRLLTLDKGFIKSARRINVPVEPPW
jgi:predicted nucleic acid-binding protein